MTYAACRLATLAGCAALAVTLLPGTAHAADRAGHAHDPARAVLPEGAAGAPRAAG